MRNALALILFIGINTLGAAQESFLNVEDYPDGSVIYCVSSDSTCYYYVTTTNNLVFTGSDRFHTSIVVDEYCDFDDLEVVEIRDVITDENDYDPDMLFNFGAYFVEYMNYRDWDDDVIHGIYNIYNKNFEYLKSDTINGSIEALYPIRNRGRNYFYGHRLLPSPRMILISQFDPEDTSIVVQEKNIGPVIISSMLYDDSTDQYLIYHNAGLGILDSAFNLVDYIHATFAHTATLGGLEFYENQVISFGARLPPNISLWQVTFNLYDRNLTLIEDETYGEEDERDYPFIKQCLEQTDEAIFTAAMLDMKRPYRTTDEPIEFVITKYDRLRNLIWRHNYGGDVAYFMFGIKATPDGGCVAYGERRNDDDGFRYPFMLKIDKDGLTTGARDLPVSTHHAFTLYGNPVDGELRIHAEYPVTNSYIVTLSNATGQVVMSSDLVNGMNDFPVRHLPAGIYVYTIVNETANRVVESYPVVVAR